VWMMVQREKFVREFVLDGRVVDLVVRVTDTCR
jgi:hypothetical protein